jgi:asparaginyl-tRNA synthetase
VKRISPVVLPPPVTAAAERLNRPVGIPEYSGDRHYLDVAQEPFFCFLLNLRHALRLSVDKYFAEQVGATSVDLYMYTSAISSPMGPGSNSEVIPFEFGGKRTNLTDSSQFGFEPLLLNEFRHLYCFLPSLRGERPDNRHLNQFYHAEYEGRVVLDEVLKIAGGLVCSFFETLRANLAVVNVLSRNPSLSEAYIDRILSEKADFDVIKFDEAAQMLEKTAKAGCIEHHDGGRDFTVLGEITLCSLLSAERPFWVTHYDRDRVPFYQKPDPDDPKKVLNADLIFPPLFEGAIGGEIVGAGQRQDDSGEIRESLNRQGIDPHPYEWYINLRDNERYGVTSGFGIGFERFISNVLGLYNVRDAIIYPRLRGDVANP